MASRDPAGTVNRQAAVSSRFGAQAVVRWRAAFEQSRNPMLISDDHRLWVTGNAAACDLFGVAREDIPWRTMDDFSPSGERRRLEDQWDAFLSTGAAEGWYQLCVPNRGAVSVEFSTTANVLPGRHLSVFIAPESERPESAVAPEAPWTPVAVADIGRLRLTKREREVVTAIASGLQSGDIAERMFVSPETVKSHVRNAMGKLGAHTRAHAVAIALVTGQILMEESERRAGGALQSPPHRPSGHAHD